MLLAPRTANCGPLFFLFFFIAIGTTLTGQTPIFTENFDEANGAMTGLSQEGISWASACPSCIDANDWFEVRNNQLHAEDVNGPATFSYTIPQANLNGQDFFSMTLNFTGSGAVYESTGNTAVDYVQIEYRFGTGALVLMDSVMGNNINNGLLTGTDIPLGTGDLEIIVTLQNWAANEDIRITGVTMTASAALPVELLFFAGQLVNDRHVELQWATATETNNAHMVVEKRTAAGEFEKVGTVEGAINSSVERYYQFTDQNPTPGQNYYRLRQVDLDGSYTFSGVVVVQHTAEVGATLYPTVAAQSATLQLDSPSRTGGSVTVVDAQGQVVWQSALRTDQTTLNVPVSELAPGHYFAKLTADNQHQTLRFVRP